MRFNSIQNSFTFGEISPRCRGRTDLPIFGQGLEAAFNFICYPEGGGGRRPGSQFRLRGLLGLTGPDLGGGWPSVPTIRPFPTIARVFPFVMSKTETYWIIMTTSAEPYQPIEGVTTYLHIYQPSTGLWGYVDIATTAASGKGYMQPFIPPSSAAQLRQMQFKQTGNTIFFTHPDLPPFFIRQTTPAAAGAATLPGVPSTYQLLFGFEGGMFYENKYVGRGGTVALDYLRNWPFLNVNTNTAVTMTAAAATGSNIDLTCSTSFWDSGHVGSVFKITDDGNTVTGVCVVRSITSATVAKVNIIRDFSGTAAAYQWEESAWSIYRGWPRSLSFFQGRAIYGGNKYQPDTVWGSQTYDVFELSATKLIDAPLTFPAGATDDQKTVVINQQPFVFTLVAEEVNQIQWMTAGKNLALGTHGREVAAGQSEAALGPLNPDFPFETSHGSAYVQPVRIQNSTIFVQRSGQRILEFAYNWNESAYKAENLNKFAEHMVRKAMEEHQSFSTGEFQMIAHQEGNEVTWFMDSNGGLTAITRDRDAGTTAWHYHVLGGRFNGSVGDQGGMEAPKVKSICSTPSEDGTHDELVMMVERDIDGDTVLYLETIGRDFQLEALYNSSTDINNKPIYCDSAILVQKEVATTTCDGLDHLEGEEVVCIANGNYVGYFTVTNGEITVDEPAKEFIVGLNYSMLLITNGIDAGSQVGSSQGAMKRIDHVCINFVRAIGAKVGFREDQLEAIPFRAASLELNTPTPLFTGEKILKFNGDYETKARVIVSQEDPMPCSLSSIVTRGVTYD